jgi:hypothetical protein
MAWNKGTVEFDRSADTENWRDTPSTDCFRNHSRSGNGNAAAERNVDSRSRSKIHSASRLRRDWERAPRVGPRTTIRSFPVYLLLPANNQASVTSTSS